MEKIRSFCYRCDINTPAMSTPFVPDPEEDRAVVFNMSPELEAELLRRAREKGTDPASEVAEILEDHVRESGDLD